MRFKEAISIGGGGVQPLQSALSTLSRLLVVTAFTQILDGGELLTSVVETPLQYPTCTSTQSIMVVIDKRLDRRLQMSKIRIRLSKSQWQLSLLELARASGVQ